MEAVAEAAVSALLQVLFDRLASSEFAGLFKGQRINSSLLKKLKETLASINELLMDAEAKQNSSIPVKMWVRNLKISAYKADDLLDEIAYETLRSKLLSESQVRSFIPFRIDQAKKKMEAKLEEILEKLEYLVSLKDVLVRDENFGERPSTSSLRIPTTSLVDDSSVYGRKDDVEAILKSLLSDASDGSCPDVISLVGMGGVGKTTLAQLLYNDSRVMEWFDLRAWVSVSQEFDILEMSKAILECFNLGPSDYHGVPLSVLQLELMEKLGGKRFLLVLDDVWNENHDNWILFLAPLTNGAKGSKIVATTRSQIVALGMSSVLVYHLNVLSDDNCWLLFSQHAFGDRNFSGNSPELEVIGKYIVKKCKGLPLAAKVLGGLLCGKGDIRVWNDILRANLWDLANENILPALRLHYLHLPSHLKQCFSFCAIFPKNYEFQKEELVLLWMAEGFVHQQTEGKEMEIGFKMFDELVLRSFFQQGNVPSYFTMHDFMNDLATLESKEFCSRLEHEISTVITENTCHLSFSMTENEACKIFDRVYEAPLLRTFYSAEGLNSRSSKYIDDKVLHDLVSKLHHLRVLSLSGYNNIDILPPSIGDLIHLRYLDVSKMSIRKLPESLCNLYNLQTLILLHCERLIKLPAKMGQLINMCYLEIGGTELQEMPPWMGKLTKLQKLTYFIVGRQSQTTIKELAELQHLRGEFCIRNLHNVVHVEDAFKANLKAKEHLKKLELTWNGDTDNSLQDAGVLELLRPHTNLEDLSIVGYGGTRFPKWIGNPSFSNMVSLKLFGCKSCCVLPPLWQLSSLKDLSIVAFDGVEAVGPEFHGISTEKKMPFGSLEILRFERIPNWQEWYSYAEKEGAAFPLLQELYLIECPNLVKALPNCLPSLKILLIAGCQKLLADSFPRAPSVLRMKFMDDDDQYVLSEESDNEIRSRELFKSCSLKLFPDMEILRTITCSNLNSVSASERHYGDFTFLYSIEIWGCNDLISFYGTELNAQNLSRLSLWGCANLKFLPESMSSLLPSLAVLQIIDCPELESFPAGGLPSKLQSLEIESCNKLFAGRLAWEPPLPPSLSHFRIAVEDDVESFPEKTLLPSSIAYLEIEYFQNLQSLNYEGLQHLTLLKELTIWNCPNLKSIPEEGLPKSLFSLSICNCLWLEQRCQQGKGEDWPKISHIPCVKINHHKVN